MPEISRFFGIVIRMFLDDHNPSHFHAQYAKFEAVISIEDFKIIEGKLPPRVYGLIVEWATIHKEELKKNWNLAKNLQNLEKIKPLV